MRAVHKKDGITFEFSGDLAEEVKKAEKELEEKENSQKRVFIAWEKDRAVKEYNTYEGRINDLRSFIKLAKEKLKLEADIKRKEQEEGEK